MACKFLLIYVDVSRVVVVILFMGAIMAHALKLRMQHGQRRALRNLAMASTGLAPGPEPMAYAGIRHIALNASVTV
jgi:hypothetical protein